MIQFTVDGEPKGKARPRFTRYSTPYTPETTVSYEERIRLEFWKIYGVPEPEKGVSYRLDITAVFGVPESASKKKRSQMLSGEIVPVKKPDVDNIAKIVADALNGVVWHDDAQITALTVRKKYGEKPCVIITAEQV